MMFLLYLVTSADSGYVCCLGRPDPAGVHVRRGRAGEPPQRRSRSSQTRPSAPPPRSLLADPRKGSAKMSSATEAVNSALSNAADVANKTAGTAVDAANGAIESAGDAVGKVADSANSAVSSAADGLNKAAGEVTDAANGVVSSATEGVNGAVSSATEGVNKAVDEVAGAVNKTADATVEAANGAVSAATEGANKAADAVADATNSVATGTADASAKIEHAATQAAEPHKDETGREYTTYELNLAGAGGFTAEDDVVEFKISLRNLPVMDVVGTIDPYIRISRKKEGSDSWTQMYVTEPIWKNQSPDYEPFALNFQKLADGSTSKRFLIEVLDKDPGSPKDDYVGLTMLGLSDVRHLPVAFELRKPVGLEYKEKPFIHIHNLEIKKGKDAHGGPTLNADGTVIPEAQKALKEAASETKADAAERLAKENAAAERALGAYAGGLSIAVPKGPVQPKGGVFSFSKWLGLDSGSNVWRG